MQAVIPRRVLIILWALLAAGAPVSAAEQSPRDFVTAIYQTYVGKDAKGILINSPRARQVIAPSLMKLIDADARTSARRNDAPRLDGDPFVDAQDFDIKSFQVEVKELGPAKATATIRFKNEAAAEDNPMVLDLVKLDGAWRIDDFRGGSGSVRKFLGKKPTR